MGLSLSISNLVSRTARSISTGGNIVRNFKPSNHGLKTSSNGGILGSIIDVAKRFVGWILSTLWSFISKFISWSLSAIWGLFCRAVSFIWRFQWNQSDAQMQSSLTNAWNAFGSTLGGAVGNTLGSLIVLGGGATLFLFNEAMAVYVLREVGEEALEELAQQAANVTNALVPIISNWVFTNCYIKARNLIGANPDAAFQSDAQIDALYNSEVQSGRMTQQQANDLKTKAKQTRNALKGERKPFSFANQWEEYVEQVQQNNPFWGNFLEECFEETFEAIQERGYVAAQAVDSYITEHKMGQQVANGHTASPITVELTLNRSLDPDPAPTPTPTP